MEVILNTVAHLLVGFTLPPLLPGIINKVKAWFGGRVGPPVFQLYFDLIKLFQKGAVFSTTTTWVFRAGPVLGLACLILALLLVPLVGPNQTLLPSFTGDLLVLVYLLGLARFFTASAALDTGSPFEGMGAVREVTFASLAEPAFLFGLVVLTQLSKSLTLSGMLGDHEISFWSQGGASLVLVLASWFLVLLVENCRIPFDDPNTHLELTMIHEVMVLDHSGPGFGMILYTASLKLFLFCALIVRVLLPFSFGNLWLDWLIFLPAVLVLAVLVGVVESIMARLRLPAVPQLLVAACVLSAFGMILQIPR